MLTPNQNQTLTIFNMLETLFLSLYVYISTFFLLKKKFLFSLIIRKKCNICNFHILKSPLL